MVCPEPHDATGALARTRPSLDELAVVRVLQNAERSGSVSALDSALRATIVLAASVGGDADAGHARCEAWPLLTIGHVLTRTLWETMPSPYRLALAHVAQRRFFAAYAPREPEPEFLEQVPEFPLPEDADLMWRLTQRGGSSP